MGFVRSIAGRLKHLLPLSRQTRIVAAIVPRKWRFRFALTLSRWQGRLKAALGRNGALTEALMLDLWLQDLTFHGPYPIPYRVHGREVLERFARPGPVLYCWTHLPLAELPLRAIVDLGFPPPAVVASAGRIVAGGELIVSGLSQRLPALPADFRVFAQVRRALARGTPICCLADDVLGGELSANPLRLAGRMHVPVIFQWGELAPDGVIDITFREAPHPFCETEAEIAENLAFLREANGRVLHSLGFTPPDAHPQTPGREAG